LLTNDMGGAAGAEGGAAGAEGGATRRPASRATSL
jgi:hypothetical protein